MAWTVSGLFVSNWIDILDTTQLVINLDLTTYKLALFDNTVVPDYGAAAASAAFNAGVWLTTAEATDATNWPSGGKLLSAAATGGTSTAPAVTQSPAGTLMYDMNDVVVASVTLNRAAYGALLHADPLTPKAGICGIYFGGSGYQPTNGTFTITWAATGVFALDLTP